MLSASTIEAEQNLVYEEAEFRSNKVGKAAKLKLRGKAQHSDKKIHYKHT